MSNAAITTKQLTGWLRRFHDLVIKNQAEVTELDSRSVMPIMASTWCEACQRSCRSSTGCIRRTSTNC